MPEMSGKFKSNPTKTNNLIYVMIGGIYFSRGGGEFTPPPTESLYTPLNTPLYAPVLTAQLDRSAIFFYLVFIFYY